MTQQMGSASGTAPVSRANEAAPGGASGLTSESMTNGEASGGAPRVTEADWQEPGSAEPAGLRPAGPAVDTASADGIGSANGTAESRAARMRGWLRRTPPATGDVAPVAPSVVAAGPELDLAANDPLIGYLLSAASAVDITRLELRSPALDSLQAAGVVLVVPLISSGSLVGLLSLGPRRSERGYSTDDLRLLNSLAGYAAPAMRVDFIPLPDGRVMFVVGDVTDKGVPAALVMASTHALLRDAAPRLISPGKVLGHVNDMLCVDIPAHMFVTCLALVLDPVSGEVEFANAGHDVPYVRTQAGVQELRARGMPLGLMPGMPYEEMRFQFEPGDCALLHSDGLAEAHAPDREMFGFPRVSALVGKGPSGEALIDLCLTELSNFTGPDHEQEDDITLVSLQRSPSAWHQEQPR